MKKEDRRILKTKENLRRTMLFLLQQKTFESITVTEICEKAQTSRITFYAHYEDKYQLADECIELLVRQAEGQFDSMEKTTNPERDPIVGAENLLKTVLDLYEENASVFEWVGNIQCSYIGESFYRKLMNNVQKQLKKIYTNLPRTEDVKRLCAFITGGMMSFVNECKRQKVNLETLKKDSCAMLRSLLSYFAPRPSFV